MLKISILIPFILSLYGCNQKPILTNEEVDIDSTYIYLAQNDMDGYAFDSVLTDGFWLKYKAYRDTTGDLLHSLTLMKEESPVKILNETSFSHLHKNLGYTGADFDSTFVLVHSFGSGNPHYIEMIEKKTGEQLFEGIWLDADEQEQVLVYMTNTDSDSIFVLDNRNDTTMVTTYFTEIYADVLPSKLWADVRIDTVTSEFIRLELNDRNSHIKQTFKRK